MMQAHGSPGRGRDTYAVVVPLPTQGIGRALRTTYAGGSSLPSDIQALLDRIP